jgi:hypothetical protein
MSKKPTTARELAHDLEGAISSQVDVLNWISAILTAIDLAHHSEKNHGDLIAHLADAAKYIADDQAAIGETTLDQLREVLA